MSNASSPRLGPGEQQKRSPWYALRAGDGTSTPPGYASDPKYKKYAQQVEKCLVSFDNVHEWADFISFLKQLLKTFQSYQQFKEIPRKLVVSKRLAQCLNPALPNGVHQRALDVYTHVFAVLGSEGLQRDLALWSSGLFPFFEYAATAVKPTVLRLFEVHYLPLQAQLRPVMKSFILALLPGLEEETGEYFDKVLALLDRLAGTISQSFFFQNIWLVILTTPRARGTALSYLSRRLPPFKTDEDVTPIVGSDIGLMIRAFSAALEDDDLLVRRGTLDILLQSLRIGGVAVKKAQEDDRAILMQAATSVVLRRDLALNRRLFAWLLGPAESSQAQTDYYKEHSLQLLRSTLRAEMFNPSPEYSQSRPFKIFISLLDKWEIGLPLTEILVYDAFKALRKALDSGPDPGDDLTMTGSTLYEAVEQHALWNRLLVEVVSDLEVGRGSNGGCVMVKYLLTRFHSHDEEIESIHLPVVFTVILALLSRKHNWSDPSSLSTMLTGLSLEVEILKHVSPAALNARPPLPQGKTPASNEDTISFTYHFYGIAQPDEPSTPCNKSTIPFVTAFEDVICLTIGASQSLLDSGKEPATARSLRDVLLSSLSILDMLASRLDQESTTPFVVDWNPTVWLSTVLKCMQQKATTFSVVDRLITVAVKIHQTERLEPALSLNKQSYISTMVNMLLSYLRPSYSTYHARVVSLIWSLQKLSTHPHVESVIAQSLSSRQPAELQDACEAFGVLWRLTDDSMLPGIKLKVPMMSVLETLRSEDPKLRRIGETWMRCSLKSYLRVLDPILFDLFDPNIRFTPSRTELKSKQLQSITYERSFDQRYTNYMLETLLSVIKFGGQGFSKVARNTPVSRSSYGPLLHRLQSVSSALPDASYMDIIVSPLLMRILQSEPKDSLGPTMSPFNMVSQSLSVDILQSLVARNEVDFLTLQSLESVVVQKLYFCVHTARLDLQNKLLHLLHSLIVGSITGSEGRGHGPQVQLERGADDISPSDIPPPSSKESHAVHSLLIQTLVDGISSPSNRPVLQHWLDFVMITVPQFKETLKAVVTPLTECVCRQLRLGLAEILDASTENLQDDDVLSYTTDSDFMMLLSALERLSLLSMTRGVGEPILEEEQQLAERNQESTGLLGYVSNVFSSDGATANEDVGVARSTDFRCLHNAVRVLYAMWEKLIVPPNDRWASQEESLALIYTRARTRSRRVFEHLFRAHPTEVLEAVVDCWSEQVLARPDNAETSTAYDLVDVLTSSAQTAVHMLCESISIRIPGLSDRAKKPAAFGDLPDMTLFEFLQQYVKRLESPLALQVWNRFLQLAKDLVGSLRDFRPQAFAALQCFTVLADKVSQTTALDDRRIRKDMQDTYGKLLDICVLSGRSVESGSWIRRTQRDLITNGRDSPTPISRATETMQVEKSASSTSLPLPLPENTKPSYSADVVQQVNLYIASDALPNVRRFLIDADKILVACNQIVYNIVVPALKGKARPLDVEDDVITILREMTKINVAVKAWRSPVIDSISDNRCFNSTADAGEKWMPMIKLFFDTDKTALPELLGKITTVASANIFTNREYEMLLRSLNLRRLSYVILSAEKNHFLTQLPSIQEKLVDTLRNVSAPIVQSEVFLCVRILLCRLSPHNLSSFWPVILTELYRIFELLIDNLPGDGSEELSLVLSASKLLDLLLVLQTEEFQVHQWIFITDTVDAVYRPDDWYPEALLDRLSEVVGALPVTESAAPPPMPHAPTPSAPSAQMRRPLLQSLRQIDSIRDLVPFFSTASISSYESVYHSGGVVDWALVERGLLEDLFEGR